MQLILRNKNHLTMCLRLNWCVTKAFKNQNNGIGKDLYQQPLTREKTITISRVDYKTRSLLFLLLQKKKRKKQQKDTWEKDTG